MDNGSGNREPERKEEIRRIMVQDPAHEAQSASGNQSGECKRGEKRRKGANTQLRAAYFAGACPNDTG